MIIDNDPFLTSANFVKPLKQEDVFVLDINGVTLYQHVDPLDASFILEAYLNLGESNANFFRRINVEGGILKVCLRCEKYYDKVKVLLANQWEKERIDTK